MMFTFPEADVSAAYYAVCARRTEAKREHVKMHEISVLTELSEVFKVGNISKRLVDVCREHTDPKDLKVSIFGFNPHLIIGKAGNMSITRGDLINNESVLYNVSRMFNENTEERFRVSISTRDGWSTMWLHFYPFGVPKWLQHVDPEMPGLDSVEEPLPASPIVNPEDDEQSDHGNCVCRDCRM